MTAAASARTWIACTAVVLAAGAAHGQAPADPQSAWAAMQKCGALANDAARHACTDEVLRNAGAMAPPEARAEERRKSFGLELPKIHAPTIAHKREAREVAQAPGAAVLAPARARAAPAEDPDRVTVTLEQVTLRGDGKLVVSTAEGAVWREVDDDPVRPTPKSGQAMTIKRTALGGFMCKTDRWTSFRCTREP